jgi:hypothetical protein
MDYPAVGTMEPTGTPMRLDAVIPTWNHEPVCSIALKQAQAGTASPSAMLTSCLLHVTEQGLQTKLERYLAVAYGCIRPVVILPSWVWLWKRRLSRLKYRPGLNSCFAQPDRKGGMKSLIDRKPWLPLSSGSKSIINGLLGKMSENREVGKRQQGRHTTT